jgi:hypothetical protein
LFGTLPTIERRHIGQGFAFIQRHDRPLYGVAKSPDPMTRQQPDKMPEVHDAHTPARIAP